MALVDQLPPVCILAGGRGIRLGDLTAETPKPLLTVAGRPFLEHILESLSHAGIRDVVLSIGYLAERFRETIGDGSRFGLRIAFVEDGAEPAGTAGGVRNCLPFLGSEFLVMYGDSLLRADPATVVAAHHDGGRLATMTVLPAAVAPEPPNCTVAGNAVLDYAKHPAPPDATHIDYGMLVFERAAFDAYHGSDLADLQQLLARSGQMTACVVHTPYTEIGTPAALAEAEDALTTD
jgi:NDP-sugar pyrophosphorylase family protein